MKIYKSLLLLFILLYTFTTTVASAQKRETLEADIVVYGGTSAGVMAAYSAKKLGKKVILVEPGKRLGGMTSGGLGYTDIGNKYVVTGLSRDFYRRVGQHYGKFEQWIFEPKVAEGIFNDYAKAAGFNILYKHRLKDVKKKGDRIEEIVVEDSFTPTAENFIIKGKVFIDCSYEGDLLAKAGASYFVGREANSAYGETLNGVQLMDGHQFPNGVDPYVVRGDATSGLLYGVSSRELQAQGSEDKKVQAYNFRIALTNVPENRVAITQPDNYDASKYELLLRIKEKNPWKSLNDVMIWSKMPNGKTDINNRNGFSTDMIGENWDYPEASYEKRAKITKDHEDYTKGFLYFLGNDPRIPENVRAEMKQWGYPKDEYTDNGNWTPQLYIREARRMIGELVMTQHHCQGKELVNDGVGMAAYTMDSHNCDRHVVNGMVKNEGNVEVGGFGPYPISYRAIIPKRKEVSNLIVPVCLSATHIAYGSIRMEPVFMVLAQSAAIAATIAVDQKITVQDVDVAKIQQILKSNPLLDGSTPEILVDNENSESIKLTGDWSTETKGGYGPSFLVDTTGATIEKTVQFVPEVIKDGKYSVYVYFPKLQHSSSRTLIKVFNNGKASDHVIDHSKTQVEGQTSGEWVSLGAFNFKKGKKGYVQISNKNADGTSIADAVLFVPVKSK